MKCIRKTFAWAVIFIIVAGIFSPDKGWAITIQQEEELSREFLKVIFKRFELIDDPIIVNHVSNIGNKIIATLPPQPFKYKFYIIKQHDYNAFASPAGHIFLYSGLLMALENEEELAGIIAHEIAHVVSRHISQNIERSKKIGMATLAGIAAGILLGAGGAGEAASAVTAGSMAAGQSIALKYSREDESQADQLGLDCMTRAGYQGKGLIAVLKKLRSKQWFGENEIPSYLMTHPTSKERMAFIDTWLEQNEFAAPSTNPYEFDRSHAWLIAMHGDTDAAVKKFQEDVREDPSDPLGHYGYGLVLARSGNRKDAIGQLKKALVHRAFDPYFLKDLGRVYFLEGRYTEALNVLKGTINIAKNDPECLFYLGRTQMELGQLGKAATIFEDLVSLKPNYEQTYYYLGQTYGKLGQLGDAHFHLGIYYDKKGKVKNALFHLNRALEKTTDPGKKATIETMLGKIQKKIKSAQNDRKTKGRPRQVRQVRSK
ncbi:MAG: M48 family metalloprotease [Desulfobacterales bacterium]|nr:MAG: M48 family metalloprotease [Desulfobacterales bacterium]